MKLYSWATAPNPRRTRIFVAEKAIEIEIVEAGDPDMPAQLSPGFCARFPHRRVPILELDDGNWIGEAAAICRYIETMWPEPFLMGQDPFEAAQIEMWDRLAESEGLLAVSEVFRNTHKAFVGRGMAGYDQDIPQIPELADRGRVRLDAFHKKLDQHLDNRDFIVGEDLTLADITAFCALDFGVSRRLPIPDSCENLRRWHAEIAARPSVT